jgi:hypothetical protein
MRGEEVVLFGQGLYRYESIGAAAQVQAADAVTLALAVPLLLVSLWLALRGSLRGQLLLAGTLGYFLYTYMSMAFLAAYNSLFLVYVALFALSLYAFVLTMLSFNLAELPNRFSSKLPRRAIAGLLFGAGAFLLIAWLGRIIPPLLQGVDPVLENATTLVIQAMDLGLIVPLAFLAGILLLRRSAWGYLLASVAVMKFLTMGAAVSAMGIYMLLSGVEVSVVELGVFPTITVVNAILAILLLKDVQKAPQSGLNRKKRTVSPAV